MKTLPSLLFALIAGVLLAAPLSAEEENESVTITWSNTDKYRDVRSTTGGPIHELKQFKPAIEREVQKYVKRQFPEGTQLTMDIVDVVLAGRVDFARAQEIRVIKSIYPPAMTFSFTLSDAEGNVLAEDDKKRISDVGFLFGHQNPVHRDRYEYETEMVRDWLRSLKRETKI